ncbi:hypothetical protein ILYODFUR_015672 [Ilyodon furcidens]|uniref:Uncharacterized protein n=1 Tax=Ilyodon furcidens TaxID=33524 RepID=A0ABV0TKG0_9TELE
MLLFLNLALSVTYTPPHTVYSFIAKSNETPSHTISPSLSLSLSHAHIHTPSFLLLVRLAHIFHLILPFLCLFLTSLYSQSSIGAIPANYPQYYSHYFPVIIFPSLPLICSIPSFPLLKQTHQLPDSFQLV